MVAVSASDLPPYHVHVEAHPREPDDRADDRAVDELAPARALLGAQDDLRGIQGPSRLHQGLADVGAGHLAVAPAKPLDEPALLLQQAGRRCREAGLRPHVHGDEIPVEALRHACRAPHEPVAVRGPGEGDEHPLARLPRRGDAVAHAVLRQALLDPVGDPEESQLA